MELLPKILIACPTSETKDYCFFDWISNVKNIDYPKDRMEILVVDNSSTNSYKKYLETWGIKVHHVKPHFEEANPKNKKKVIRNKPMVQTVCESENIIRKYAYENNFDYILMLESDIMIGQQTLRTLVAHKKQVISAAYFHGNDKQTNLLITQIEKFPLIKTTIRLGFKATMKFMDGKVKQVQSCGIGCCLIHRSVFKKVPFRYVDSNGAIDKTMFPDSYFYEDLYRMETPAFIDTSIILEHNSQEWAQNINLQ
jgi:hypothetical protein